MALTIIYLLYRTLWLVLNKQAHDWIFTRLPVDNIKFNILPPESQNNILE